MFTIPLSPLVRFPGAIIDYDNFMGSMRIVNCDSWVTLRSEPSTHASTVTRVPLGEYVQAYKYNDKFMECYYNGMHGYILKNYLR